MNLLLERMTFTDESTIGELSIDGEFTCFVLEDTCRDHKISGRTAIPAGKYLVTMQRWEKRNADYPILHKVPDYDGIYIHKGNTPEDTEGCLLVGMKKGDNVIYDSGVAFEIVKKAIKEAKGDVYISIVGGRTANV